MKKFLLMVLVSLVLAPSAFALDYVWKNATSKTGVMSKSTSLSLSTVTLTGLIANVTTSSVTISTGNVNIPVTVNGVLLYIKARTAP